MTQEETIQKIEARYVELWNEGLRPTRIFRKLSVEFSLSVHTLQKRLDVRKLKKELTE